MITNFFFPELNNHDVQELWFQQDGATCHTARATIDLLKDTLGDRLISRFGPVNWPARSCDLTPLDYFLWGYVKSLVYADKPQTLDHLEDNIRRVIADIRPQMLEKVIENWTSRLDSIRASRGSPMPEILFKIRPEAFYVWRTPREAFNPECLLPTVKHRGGSIMVWGAISWHSLGPLFVLDGRIESNHYLSVLGDHVQTVFPEERPLFQDDNAPIHTARCVQVWFEEHDVEVEHLECDPLCLRT
ncbi:transposable element Tcb1 transposase [Trichonephila clavipes]|nr:transposable element Tcb1 transposase [Trichonephila clavipes]